MENNEICVEFVTDKIYFIEDAVNISFKFNKKSLKPKYSDWIALFKCNSNRNLEEFIAVETDLTIRSPSKHGLNPVTFYANQLKNVDCSLEYEFLYGNKFNEICGISRPIRFIHKNKCAFCHPDVLEEASHCNCVSQELISSLLARISVVDSQLIDCKLQSNEIMSMNKRLMAQLNECEAIVQKNSQLLDNLLYTNEPVTKDGYGWIQPCTDTDLKTNIISNQECELQDLSNQNSGLQKILNRFNKEAKEKYSESRSETDSNVLLDSVISVEGGVVPEPLTASIVFIDNDEEEV